MKTITSLNFGGAETQVINLSKELVKQGHEVLIVSLAKDTPREVELEGSNVEIIAENKKNKIDITVIKNLRNHIKTWKPDIIHGYLYDAEFYTRVAGIGLHIPIINSERNDNYKFILNKKIGDFLTSKLVNGVIANTFAGKDFSAKRYTHLGENNLHVVWNGIDTKKIGKKLTNCKISYKDQFFGNKEIKLACMVASIKPQKDYNLALQVANELVSSDNQWRVVFLGDKLTVNTDDYKNSIINQYNTLKLNDRIKFLGNRTDVIEILSQSDVSFLTSHHEGFPNAVLESMSVGTPCVTTDFSDIKKITPYHWMIVDTRDPKEFVNALIKAAEEKQRLTNVLVGWVNDNCALDIIAKKLVDTYKGYLV